MKKVRVVFAILICAAISFATSACGLFENNWITQDQKDITDVAMKRLCSAISRRNAEEVKSQFSLYDVSTVEDFDGEVQALLEYVTGDNITFTRMSSGSDEKAMGSYPKEREFAGVNYRIKTSTDEYKVVFGYRAYYSQASNKKDEQRIGFTYFDIINVKNDRDYDKRYYSGCPFNYNGINIGYRTTYYFVLDESRYQIAFCDALSAFDPIIINVMSGLNSFYEERKEKFTPQESENFNKIAQTYDDEFFATRSLYVVGMYGGDTKYIYMPHFLYVGDFVFVEVLGGEYKPNRDESEYTAYGVIIFVEIPEKVADDVPAKMNLSIQRA